LRKITFFRRTLEEKRKGHHPSSNGEAMRNLTVIIPGDVYRRVRVWAAQRDTLLSEAARHLIEM
jgi:hypothetical protein